MEETDWTSKNESVHRKNSGHKRLPPAPKKEAVAEVRSGQLTLELAAEKYGVSNTTVRRWVLKHEAETTPPNPHESELDHRKIAREVIRGRYTMEQAAAKYNISTPARIFFWVREARRGRWKARKKGKAPKIESVPGPPMEESEAMEAMRKELEETRLKLLALETMIDVAEEELGVNIRKKSGTKQSK